MSKSRTMIALSALVMTAVPAHAQSAPKPSAVSYRVVASNATRLQAEQLRADVAAAEAEYKTLQTNKAPGTELQRCEARIRRTMIALRDAETRLQKEQFLAVLDKPIDVRFNQASVRQAALAIAGVAGMPVVVDEAITMDKRLTVDAKGVTLGLVLETLASQTDLMLAPAAAGIRLCAWPTLEVDGQKQVRKSTYAPWSEEWIGYLYYGAETPGAAPFGSGGGVVDPPDAGQLATEPEPPGVGAPPQPGVSGGLAPRAPVNPPQTAQGSPRRLGDPRGRSATPPATSGYPGMFRNWAMPAGESNVAITSLGDRMFVVAEPGFTPEGGSGTWLTVYRLEGTQLRKVSSAFHPGAQRQAMSPGVPGMGGRAPSTAPAPSRNLNQALPLAPGIPDYNYAKPRKPAPSPTDPKAAPKRPKTLPLTDPPASPVKENLPLTDPPATSKK
jgi:hypothetical protein